MKVKKAIIAFSVFFLVFQFFSFLVIPTVKSASDCNTYCNNPTTETPPPGQICICPTTHKTIEQMIKSITDYIFWLVMAAVPLMIIIGGVIVTTSGGDPKRRKTGMDFIKWTIVGLIVILFSKGIIAMVKFVFQ